MKNIVCSLGFKTSQRIKLIMLKIILFINKITNKNFIKENKIKNKGFQIILQRKNNKL